MPPLLNHTTAPNSMINRVRELATKGTQTRRNNPSLEQDSFRGQNIPTQFPAEHTNLQGNFERPQELPPGREIPRRGSNIHTLQLKGQFISTPNKKEAQLIKVPKERISTRKHAQGNTQDNRGLLRGENISQSDPYSAASALPSKLKPKYPQALPLGTEL
ncbi:hypothetical protein ACOSQ4_001117 [Xanthoceras sorbifolium]